MVITTAALSPDRVSRRRPPVERVRRALRAALAFRRGTSASRGYQRSRTGTRGRDRTRCGDSSPHLLATSHRHARRHERVVEPPVPIACVRAYPAGPVPEPGTPAEQPEGEGCGGDTYCPGAGRVSPSMKRLDSLEPEAGHSSDRGQWCGSGWCQRIPSCADRHLIAGPAPPGRRACRLVPLRPCTRSSRSRSPCRPSAPARPAGESARRSCR
jgi:hypothetical protein